MNRGKTYYILATRFMKLINIILITMPFITVWYKFYADDLWVTFFRRGHWIVIALFVILYFTIGRIYNAFKISYNSVKEMVFSQTLSFFEANAIMYIVIWLLLRHVPNVIPMLLMFGVQILLTTIWSFAAQGWYFNTFSARRTVIIWDERNGISELIKKYNLEKKYTVVDTISAEECMKDMSTLDECDAIFLVGVHSRDRNIITKYCLLHDIKAFLIPRIGDLIIMGSTESNMFHLLMFKVERFNPSYEYLIAKRFGDIALSLIATIILSPVMLITAICIKLEDHGPIIYKQCRLTKDGKEFNILKFRSMKVDAEKDGVARLSSGEDDDRITKVGKKIRKVRIDELPQLFNILKGDLSIVGPRAERPEIAKQYEEELPEFALRLQTKAGLTGYAQVVGKYNTTPYDKLLMDLTYIANANVFEDLRIIFATIKVLFMPESTEGVEARQTTAMKKEEE